MTPAELKTIRKRLGLSGPWCAQYLAGGMAIKSYRAQENGDYSAHPNVVENLADADRTISALIERCAMRTDKSKSLKP